MDKKWKQILEYPLSQNNNEFKKLLRHVISWCISVHMQLMGKRIKGENKAKPSKLQMASLLVSR